MSGLKALTIPDSHLVVLFVSPPWGTALNEECGLDFRRTTPAIVEIVDLATDVLGEHKLLFAIQAYEIVTPAALAQVTERFQWSALDVYDINEQALNPGLLLGSSGWAPRAAANTPARGRSAPSPRRDACSAALARASINDRGGRRPAGLLHAATAPYAVLGCGYAVLAVALLMVGSRRHRALARARKRGETAPLPPTTVTLFTRRGVVLATATTVVVLAQS